MEAFNMRQLRTYLSDVWYEVSTTINSNEPVFLNQKVKAMFEQVFREAEGRFKLDLRDLVIERDRITFCVKSTDGNQLPLMIKWLKQTFSARFNALYKRTGHLWAGRAKVCPWTEQKDCPPPPRRITQKGCGPESPRRHPARSARRF
jgi:REP element-mobilizing transposase RayT